MSLGDDMLTKLGYTKYDLKESEYFFNKGKKMDWIEFLKNEKKIKVRADLSLEELKAINIKCKEIGLIYEEKEVIKNEQM